MLCTELTALNWKLNKEYGSDIDFQQITFVNSIIILVTENQKQTEKNKNKGKEKKKHIINGLYLIKALYKQI